uniref:NCK associated protein 5 like n=1 Tax=Sphenodon punctatus TaxID=8508 RepID=A0A8D0HK52_SPHPU
MYRFHPPFKGMMAETELQGDMKPEGVSSEPGTSQELLQRLRELEAENAALAQANENQRETYERCLDEVANHVVQALLNQKDLREECIKLKKRVFDLERQNQTLSDLFYQKLQLTAGSLPQLPARPLPALLSEPLSGLQLSSAEKLLVSLPAERCALQREVCSATVTPHPLACRPGGSAPSPQSLEALSPFLRKKARILEVLRSLEETDPLLSCPPPWRDPGQPISPEGVGTEAWPGLLLAPGAGEAGQPLRKGEGSSSSSSDEADAAEKGPPGQALLSALAERKLELGDVESYLQHVLREAGEGALLNGGEPRPSAAGYKHMQAVSCLEPAFLGVYVPGEELPGKDKERDRPHPGAPIPSPSKVLKLLKMPPPVPPGSAALRLSPQLTRSSKIPCRSNAYEVYHSPAPSRKGSPDGPLPPEQGSPKAGRHLIPVSPRAMPPSPEPLGYQKAHDYENVSELVLGITKASRPQALRGAKPDLPEVPPPVCRPVPLRALPPVGDGSPEPCPFATGREKLGTEGRDSPPLPIRRNTGGAWKPPAKRAPEPLASVPFRERLTALGRLKGTDGKEPPGAEKGRGASRPCERADTAPSEGPAPRLGVGGSSSLKHHEPCHGSEPVPPRCYSSHSVGSRGSGDPEHHAGKNRPPGTRPPGKAPTPAKNKSPHGSPTKLPSKSPTKAPAPRPPGEEPKPCPVPAKPPSGSAGRKNPPFPDSSKGKAAAPATIEEKVMKGIEENVLRLHKGPAASSEAKQKNSSGLASWFGLRRSKLPALSRRPDAPKGKEGKLATRRLEAESLNISRLMEKAEDLRKALEEEKAYINGLVLDKPRPHACEPGHGQLSLVYQEVTAQDFMQQLLNRWGRKGVQGAGRGGGASGLEPGVGDGAGSQDSWEPVPSSPRIFIACGSLTRTLDSGIGTFPPPDYCSGTPCKSAPKVRPRLDPALPGPVPVRVPPSTRVPRKARTLEREVPSAEDLLAPSKHRSMPAFHGVLASAEPSPGHRPRRGCPQGPRVAGHHTCVGGGGEEGMPHARLGLFGKDFPLLPWPLSLSPQDSAHNPIERRRTSSDGPQASPAFSTGSSRTPSASDVGEEGSTEARSRDTGQEGQPGLENSESLSDSLYDSLSSCGSQG